jgi:hypothetical protein
MTSRQSPLTLAVLVSSIVILLSCSLSAATVDVDLVFDTSNGNCTQRFKNLGGVLTSGFLVDPVPSGSPIKWTAKIKTGAVETPATSFDIQFLPGGSPFYDYNSPGGGPVTSAPATGTNGTKHRYSSVTINGRDCNNEHQLGIIMR